MDGSIVFNRQLGLELGYIVHIPPSSCAEHASAIQPSASTAQQPKVNYRPLV